MSDGILSQQPPDHIREAAQQDYEQWMSGVADRLKFQQELGLGAIRSMILVNGGAVLALLTFLGNKSQPVTPADLRAAFLWYGVGLSLALLTFFAGYLGQGRYMWHDTSQAYDAQLRKAGLPEQYGAAAKKEARQGMLWTGLAVALLLASLLSFAAGSWRALNGIVATKAEVSLISGTKPRTPPPPPIFVNVQ